MPSKSASDYMPAWGFRSKLRRASFGWRGSHAAIARIDEAVAEIRSAARSDPVLAAEGALLDAGRRADAYTRYAIDSNQGNSRIATFRALRRRYPEIEADRLLADLIASTPGEEGKWFATAKSLHGAISPPNGGEEHRGRQRHYFLPD